MLGSDLSVESNSTYMIKSTKRKGLTMPLDSSHTSALTEYSKTGNQRKDRPPPPHDKHPSAHQHQHANLEINPPLEHSSAWSPKDLRPCTQSGACSGIRVQRSFKIVQKMHWENFGSHRFSICIVSRLGTVVCCGPYSCSNLENKGDRSCRPHMRKL